MDELVFRTPTQCASSGCVEVAVGHDGVRLVRDVDGHVCAFTETEWADFTTAVKAGEF